MFLKLFLNFFSLVIFQEYKSLFHKMSINLGWFNISSWLYSSYIFLSERAQMQWCIFLNASSQSTWWRFVPMLVITWLEWWLQVNYCSLMIDHLWNMLKSMFPFLFSNFHVVVLKFIDIFLILYFLFNICQYPLKKAFLFHLLVESFICIVIDLWL